MKKYILRREPVIMTGCGESWKAKNWTFEGNHIKTKQKINKT